MTYELAKKLKAAGFPQGDGLALENDVAFRVRGSDALTDGMAYAPTLSELVAACMEIMLAHNDWEAQAHEDLWFFELVPNIAGQGELDKIGKLEEWRASWIIGVSRDVEDEYRNFFGDTPEEAVANLWLQLNASKVPGRGPEEQQTK